MYSTYFGLPPSQRFTGIGSVKTNDFTSRNVHAIPILRGGMRNNSQTVLQYKSYDSAWRRKEWNPTLHWGQEGKTANLGEEYESETIRSVAFV